jgi:hypothetical protein
VRAASPDPRSEPPGHIADLVAALRHAGFTETYRDERPGPFGSFMRIHELIPVKVRVVWDGKEREWLVAFNAESWPHDAHGEIWVTLPPSIKLSL